MSYVQAARGLPGLVFLILRRPIGQHDAVEMLGLDPDRLCGNRGQMRRIILAGPLRLSENGAGCGAARRYHTSAAA